MPQAHSPRGRLRRLILLPAVFVALLTLASAQPPAAAQAEEEASQRRPSRVMVVSVPRLTWQMIVDERPENLVAFLDSSPVGNMSLRTIGPRTALGAAYTTIGAGNRAGANNADAGRVMRVSDRFENGSAGDAFNRRTGEVTEAEIIHLSIESVQARNRRYLYGATPGALGTALSDAGIRPVVIANTDTQADPDAETVTDPLYPTGEPIDDTESEAPVVGESGPQLVEPVQSENRPAGLALMTREGEIPAGKVDRSLLVLDRTAPFGVRLRRDRVMTAAEELWDDRSLLLVELSDLERADWYRSRASSSQAAAHQREALAQTDELFGDLMALAGENDIVILVSPAAPRAGETLTPFAIRGPDFESGLLTSGTTRRAGYVTLPDIAPTILHELEIDEPGSMSGSPIAASNSGDLSPDRYDRFIELNQATRFRDDTIGGITVALVVLQVVFCALALYALQRDLDRSKRVARALALFTISVPVVSFLLGLFPFHRGSSAYFVAALTGASVVLAALSARLGYRLPERFRGVGVTLLPLALTWLVLAVDITTGGRLQVNTLFGYSPVVAGRFAGFGNPAYSLFSMSAVLLSCSAWALFDGDGDRSRRRALVVGISLLFLVTLVLDGHPSFGSDVGGVLSIIPTAVVVLWLLLGRRFNLRVVAVAALLTVLAVAAFAAIDLARPVSEQTHLARLVSGLFGSDDGGGLFTVLERKLNANLNILKSSAWTWTIPLALALLVRLTWRRPRWAVSTLGRSPATNAALWGGIAMCAFGMAVNDSGIAIPAVMFTLFLPYVVCLAVTPQHSAMSGQLAEPPPPADDDAREPVGVG